jgi:hypothetical protein
VNFLRRIIAIFICFLFLFSLAACTNRNEAAEPSDKIEERYIPVNENISSGVNDELLLLIPDGWRILERIEGKPDIAEGDLNKDGIDDAAVVIEEISASEGEAPARMLLIAFGDKNDTYTLSVKAEKAILRSNEGGVWGDPLEGISIDRGSVLISFYGGSNWRWYSKYRFRFQDNEWYLIGATLGTYFTGNATIDDADEEDYNLLTGDFIIKKRDEAGNIVITKGNRGKRELVKLVDFAANSEEKQF